MDMEARRMGGGIGSWDINLNGREEYILRGNDRMTERRQEWKKETNVEETKSEYKRKRKI